MRRILSFLLTLCMVISAVAQDFEKQIKIKEDSIKTYRDKIKVIALSIEELKLAKIRQELKTIAIPKLIAGEEFVEHFAMGLVYSEKHEQAKIVH